MYLGKKIAVVIPAHNEERLIRRTVETLPDFLDHIVVVDDCSSDRTGQILADVAAQDSRLVVLRHETNRGCGVAKATGYRWCVEHPVDIAVAMDGDGQMDPADMPALIEPVASGGADYAKGNRLITGEAWQRIPRTRYLGNSVLTFLTKIASGYWHVTDSQSGYTAINRRALAMIPLEDIYPRYGWPNDLLVTLNIYNMRVVDVPVNPVYGIGETSGIRLHKITFTLSWLMARLFAKRMWQKYVIRDFHPLVLFYAFAALLFLLDVPLTARLVWHALETHRVPPINALTVVFFTLVGFQSMLFAMLFDMEANRELKGWILPHGPVQSAERPDTPSAPVGPERDA